MARECMSCHHPEHQGVCGAVMGKGGSSASGCVVQQVCPCATMVLAGVVDNDRKWTVREKQIAAVKQLYKDAEKDFTTSGNVYERKFREGVLEGIRRMALTLYGVIDTAEIMGEDQG